MVSSLERKKKVLLCILSLLLFNFFIILPSKFDKIDNNILIDKNKEITFLKNSYFYNLTGSSIFIDDSDPDYNWSKTAAEYDWCSGTGTWNDPYIIENVTIDAQNPFNIETVIWDPENSSACITIQNSNVNFIIRNCTICNSGKRILDCGINLINVNNSQIINNNCSSNSYGIISFGNNNTYSKNIINNNLVGIIKSGINSIITLNSLDNNDCGILLINSYKVKISKNNLTHHIDGLYLLDSYNNSINENSINNNKRNGIFLQTSNYNNISKNECNSNRINGIHLQGGFYYLGGPYQYCDYNWISDNNLYNNSNGILLNYTIHNDIINNKIKNNQFSGIELIHSDYIDILNNKIDGNYYGINMNYSHWNDIIQNTINNCYYGTNLKDSDWNEIIQNTINNNYYGISLSTSNMNDIIGNILHYNRICYIENGYCVGNTYEDNDCIETKINNINWLIIGIISSLIGLVILFTILMERKITVIDSDN